MKEHLWRILIGAAYLGFLCAIAMGLFGLWLISPWAASIAAAIYISWGIGGAKW